MRISHAAWGWIGPISIAVLAFALRIWRVGYPNRLLFDETYYAKDAWSMLQLGYTQDFAAGADRRIESGNFDNLMTGEPSWVVHPEAGRWLIAAGEQLFGLNALGWRFGAVVAGSLTVLVLARLVLRLTGSAWAAVLAGTLLAFDGAHFVLSRLALLDVFLTLWIVCAVTCLAAATDAAGSRRYAWQAGAGICFGLAIATKWSGLYTLAAFGVLYVVVAIIRRPAPRISLQTLVRVIVPAATLLVGLALVVYVITWSGWLMNYQTFQARFGAGYGTYSEPWGAYVNRTPDGFLAEAGQALRSLWNFHLMTYEFHTRGLDESKHPYASNPIGWLVMERPVGVDAVNDLPADQCGAAADSNCMRVTTILGNPAVWWVGVLATLVSAFAWIRTSNSRWAVVVIGVLSAWLPWFANADRPIFSFYAVAALPFMVAGIALISHALVSRTSTPRATIAARTLVLCYLVLVIVLFIYFYPVLTSQLVSYDTWRIRMWLPGWI